MQEDEIKTLLQSIQALPDESVEMILPQIEDQFAQLVEEQDLVNKTKTEFLEQGYTIADIKAIKESYDSIAEDYFKIVKPTSPKGRYISALINVYKDFLDKILEEGFTRTINVKITKDNENVLLPQYAHFSDAGADLFANEDIEVASGETAIVPTGLKFEIPDGYEVQIRPRSGMSVKTKTKVVFGTVDSSYRGPIGIMLTNYGEEPYQVHKGDKIAQMIITPTYHANFLVVDKLSETDRGSGGFGSTGDGQKA